MTSDSLDPLSKARALFTNELKDHLEFLTKFIGQQELLDNRERAVINRFHLIKGSSGFFQLDKVRAIATEGENLAKSDLKELGKQLERIVGELREEYERIQGL
jgi:HPt (histidine-containing phosphotransfer) domain-containing protein